MKDAKGRRVPTRGKPAKRRPVFAHSLAKAPSGIAGLDEITGGGLPRGRPTLVCGGAGCGKTLFALEFLVRGATEHGEPGVLMSFEETEEELAANVASLGFDVRKLIQQKKLAVDHVRVERNEIEETGEFDLAGLFVRLQYAIESVGAKRVALDTIESLFSSLPNPTVLRSELRRLFRWLKDRGMTTVITGEQGAGSLTRQGLEEYVSDCVIFLDHRVNDQISTRRLRVVKYRGTMHGCNEYPFLIDETGISVLPITSMGLDHAASSERVSTGIVRLDEMLGGGYFKGTTILCSGTAGTGKTSVAAHLARSTCEKGERCLFFAFEESSSQLARNMQSIGIDLSRYIRNGSLSFIAGRPHSQGLEMHLATMHKAASQFKPTLVIVDPVSNLMGTGTTASARSMLTRLIDFLKSKGITTFFTTLTEGSSGLEQTDVGISSLIDTWLMLEVVRGGGERNRTLNLVKSRGMAHSNQTTEYQITDRGLVLLDTYLGPSGVLTGSARMVKEAEDKALAASREEDIGRQLTLRETGRKAFEARLAALQAEFAAQDAELDRNIRERLRQRDSTPTDRAAMAISRRAFTKPKGKDGRRQHGTGSERKGRDT
jgi:circadian clock protein KaiC